MPMPAMNMPGMNMPLQLQQMQAQMGTPEMPTPIMDVDVEMEEDDTVVEEAAPTLTHVPIQSLSQSGGGGVLQEVSDS